MLKRTGVALAAFGFFAIAASGASAAPIAADWTSPTAGSLNGVSFTFVEVSDFAAALTTSDLTTADFATAPLSAATESLSYSVGASWTATFAAPVSGLRLYLDSWRGAGVGDAGSVVYTFDQPFAILSGLGAAVISGGGMVLTVPDNGFHNGVIEFLNPVTSLALDSGLTCNPTCSRQALTFGVDAEPVPGPGGLALLGFGVAGLAVARRRRG